MFHEDGRKRRLRFSVLSVLKKVARTAFPQMDEGWRAFIAAKKLEPFAWHFLHDSKSESTVLEVLEHLCTQCDRHAVKVCRSLPEHLCTQCDEEEDRWLPTTDQQALEMVRCNAEECVICRNGKWKAAWFTVTDGS